MLLKVLAVSGISNTFVSYKLNALNIIVTSSDFSANQSKYIGIAHSGEDVILKSRAGSVRLIPVDTLDMSDQRLKKSGD